MLAYFAGTFGFADEKGHTQTMKLIFSGLIALFFLLANILCLRAAELSATDMINTLLTYKPGVGYQRIIQRKITECHPKRGIKHEGDHEICNDKIVSEPQEYVAPATVASSEVIEVKDLIFEKHRMVTLPETALISTQEYRHCADGTLTNSISLSVSGTSGYSVTKSESVGSTVGGSIGFSLQVFGGSLSTGMNMSRSVNVSSSVSETNSETVTRSHSGSLTLVGRKHGKLELLAYQTSVDLPYSATVILDATLNGNLSGVSKASQLLTLQERTVKFSGTVRLFGVSRAILSTMDYPGIPTCRSEDEGGLVLNSVELEFPAASVRIPNIEGVPLLFDAEEKHAGSKPSQIYGFIGGPQVSGNDDAIGPADGIMYYVLFSSEVVLPTPLCGYNDFSLPNLGYYTREARQYIQYSKGTEISRWQEQVDIFKTCQI